MILFSFGILLLIALLGGASLLAAILFGNTHQRPSSEIAPQTISYTLLIPAHNEENKIECTLEACFKAKNEFATCPEIWIALDACTDHTLTKILPWKQKLSIQHAEVNFRSKWKVLQFLLSQAKTEWVVFLDSGINFDSQLFNELEKFMKQDSYMAIGPSYEIKGASLIHRVFWKFERFLKNCENTCGGPISLHGATLAYRRTALLTVFEKLNLTMTEDFKNDDVIIPLTLRTLFPEKKIHYLTHAAVFDDAKHEQVNFRTDLNRRIRMVIGNIQWIRWYYGNCPFQFKIFLISLRRTLRPFWSLIILILILGGLSTVGPISLILCLVFLLFRGASLASFLSPLLFIFKKDQQKSAWK